MPVEDSASLAQLLMRKLQEFLQQSQFVHQFERGRMNCVTAKIAKEISVLFENHHVDAGARE